MTVANVRGECLARTVIIVLAVIVVGIAVSAGSAGAQSDMYIWEKSYGGSDIDHASDIQKAPGGGFIIPGSVTKSDGASHGYLLKLNDNGEKAWDKTFSHGTSCKFYSVLPLSDGYLCAGIANMGTGRGNDIYLVKVSSSGGEVWSKTYGTELGDSASKVISAGSGGYVVLGRTQRTDKRGYDVYLLKVNANGDMVWDSRISNQSYETCNDIKATADGGYVIVGTQKLLDGMPDDAFMLKVDSAGKKVWDKVYGSYAYDEGHAVAAVDGGYLLVGVTNSYGNGTLGDIWVIRTDSTGKELWNVTYGDKGVDYAGDTVLKTSGNGVLICGSTTSIGNGNLDYYLLKIDENGRFLWDAAYGTDRWEELLSVVQADDGSYVIAGNQQKTGNFDDIYVVRTKGGPGLNSHLNWGGQSDDAGSGADSGNSGGSSGSGSDNGNGRGILGAIIDFIKGLFGF